MMIEMPSSPAQGRADLLAEAVARNRKTTSEVYDMVRHVRVLMERTEQVRSQSRAAVAATRRRRQQLERLGIL